MQPRELSRYTHKATVWVIWASNPGDKVRSPLFQTVQTGFEEHTASFNRYLRFISEIEQTGGEVNLFCLFPTLRMGGATPQLRLYLAQVWTGETFCNFFSLHGK